MECKNMFYLPNLLRIKDLNTRETSVLNDSLTMRGYFDTLGEFLDTAPKELYALNSIKQEHSVKQNIKFIEGVKTKLNKIGAMDLTSFIGRVLAEGVNEENIHDVLVRCAALYEDIKELRNVPKTLADTGMYEPEYTSRLDNSLNDVIEWLITQNDARKLRIMAVDDAMVMLRSIINTLGDKYRVYPLAKPLMTDTLLTHIVPELFLVDYKMPEISGFDLISVIRAHKEHKETPIVIMTASGTEQNFRKAIEYGACDFIVKPFESADVLIKKIEEHIVRKPLI